MRRHVCFEKSPGLTTARCTYAYEKNVLLYVEFKAHLRTYWPGPQSTRNGLEKQASRGSGKTLHAIYGDKMYGLLYHEPKKFPQNRPVNLSQLFRRVKERFASAPVSDAEVDSFACKYKDPRHGRSSFTTSLRPRYNAFHVEPQVFLSPHKKEAIATSRGDPSSSTIIK